MLTNSRFESLDFDLFVDLSCLNRSDLCLGLTNMIFLEQKLSVKVRKLYRVIICDHHFTIWSRSNAHKSTCFYIFTSKSSSSNNESFAVLHFVDIFPPIDTNIVVISAILWLSVDFLLGQRIKDIIMKPLVQWRVLAYALNSFLSYNSS
jgi:hypothetical protein